MRNCSEPSQVARTGFEFGRIAVTQRVSGCYCASARCGRLWRSGESRTRLAKPSKGGQNGRTRREEHADKANPVKNFRAPAMLKTTPLDCELKGNLREKRRDPWLWANASPEAMADPKPVVKTRTRESQACLDLVCRPVAQPLAEAS